MHASLHRGQIPCVRSTRMPARAVELITSQSPPTLRTRLHHAHSVIQTPSSRETPHDAVTRAAASRLAREASGARETPLGEPVATSSANPAVRGGSVLAE